ncbi:MAG: hypothetical protein ABI224_01700 [Acetobacteraceae bacterium]
MPTPSLKAKLPCDGCAFGPPVFESFSAGTPTIIASIRADVALFDTEHTGLRFEIVKQQLVTAARLYETALDDVRRRAAA